MRRIAYYAHHHGSGHLRHASLINRNEEVELMVMTSGRVTPDLGLDHVLQLPGDVVKGHSQPLTSPFHYTPSGSAAETVRQRFTAIHEALNYFAPDLVMVDVSAEVASFAKLAGYKTMVRRMPGNRTDHAHLDMYELADGIVAYFPEVFDAGFDFADKTNYLGMAAPANETPLSGPNQNIITCLTGTGGAGISATELNRAALATPNWHWQVAGTVENPQDVMPNISLLGTVENISALLQKSDVIVTNGGHNSVRDAAAACRPAVIVPELRPFDEQLHFAQSLHASSGVAMTPDWVTANWRALIDQALSQRPDLLARALFVSESEFHRGFTKAVEQALSE